MKYKYKGKQILLWLLLFLNLCMPLPCMAGFETLGYTPEDEEQCSLGSITPKESGRWWQAPMQAVIGASTGVGNSVFSSVAGGAQKLMLVGAALWLAIFTLKIVGGFVESDPMENLTKIGGLMLRVGIAAWLLKNRDFFFSTFFAPIIQTGAGFAGVSISAPKGQSGLSEAGSAAVGMAGSIHEAISQFKAMGTYLKCLSKIHKLDLTIFEITLWDPGAFFGGCMINLTGWAFIAVFPFFLIDACFRMGVVAALCPLFIISWVFQSTRSYALKGFNAVVNVAFTFMMVKIASQVAIALLTEAAGLKNPADKTALVCKYRMFRFGDGSDPCAGKETGMGISSIFIFIVCVVYGLLLLKEGADKLANYFSDTGFSNDTAFQAAKGAAQAPLSAAHTAVEAGAQAGQNIRTVSKGVGAVKNFAQDRVAKHRFNSGMKKMQSGQTLSVKEQKKFDNATRRLRKRNLLSDDNLRDLAKNRRKTYTDGTPNENKPATADQQLNAAPKPAASAPAPAPAASAPVTSAPAAPVVAPVPVVQKPKLTPLQFASTMKPNRGGYKGGGGKGGFKGRRR